MIATILTTKCREVEFFPPPRWFSRQFSRQSVASGGVGCQVPGFAGNGAGHPVKLRPFWRDNDTGDGACH